MFTEENIKGEKRKGTEEGRESKGGSMENILEKEGVREVKIIGHHVK